MKHNIEDDLLNQNQSWSPDPAKLESMLSNAHQQADQIHSRRTKSITALALCFCIGLIYLGQPSDPSAKGESSTLPTDVAQHLPNTEPSESTFSEEEEENSIQALAQAEYFSSEDFDFIEDSAGFPWDQLLAEY